MSHTEPEPPDADGPLFRAAKRRADAVDNAQTPAERRQAVGRVIPTALAAFAEGILREFVAFGALLSCVVAVFAALDAESTGWRIGLITVAVVGAVLVVMAMLRRWSFGGQWAVFVGVIAVNVGLIVAMEQLTG